MFVCGRQVSTAMRSALTLALLTLSWPGCHWNASSQMADDNHEDIYLTSVRVSGWTRVTVFAIIVNLFTANGSNTAHDSRLF
jgi:hypothetical protein